MATRSCLTDEQRTAAGAQEPRVFIEAAPGSGKTAVAAERFGIHRFASSAGRDRSVFASSFTRSAVAELASRVTSRWGTEALRWPNQVTTLDALYTELLTYLLRTGGLRWPGGHTSLTVLDEWWGQRGARDIPNGRILCVAVLRGRFVGQSGQRVDGRTLHGFSKPELFAQHLRAGRCTHREVRQVMSAALADTELRAELVAYIRSTCRAMIVDEVFDANDLDLDLIRLMCEADLRVTLIGDPWQALYGFREARPDRVIPLLGELGFKPYPVTRSFRYCNSDLKKMAIDLRAGKGIDLPCGKIEDVDVVLAGKWAALWEITPEVLPLSFGRIKNISLALATLLLDQVIAPRFHRPAVYIQDALAVLGIDPPTYEQHGSAILLPIVDLLRSGGATAAEQALAELREAGKMLGCNRHLARLKVKGEEEQLKRMRRLSQLLQAPGDLIPGMTVHQAKGQEWPRVGVHLTPRQRIRVRMGLNKNDAEDRLLYVALTRARHKVVTV